jgi:hypothetical protein
MSLNRYKMHIFAQTRLKKLLRQALVPYVLASRCHPYFLDHMAAIPCADLAASPGTTLCGQKIGSEIPADQTGLTGVPSWGPCLTGCVAMEKNFKRLVQKHPQTRQEYLAGNTLDSCRSGRQITWSKDWFRNTRRPDRTHRST